MGVKIWIWNLSFLFILCGCTNSQTIKNVNAIGYSLGEPDKTIVLPYALREISGLAVIDSSTVACIQDEKGIVFIFDLGRGQITKEIYFSPDGDFEGICRVDNTLYALKSNGTIYKIVNFETSSFADKIELPAIREDDNEGLCFDRENQRLLIGPKRKSGKGPGLKKNHFIYGYDLKSEQPVAEPAYSIKTEDVAEFMDKDNPVKIKKGKKKKSLEPEITLSLSELAIHPVTGKLFLLSAEDHMLFVFDKDARVEYAEKLDPFLLNRPEGIAFFENGDMLISNESGNKYPSILRFNYRNR